MTTVIANEYAGENAVRADVRGACEDNGFAVETYQLGDKGNIRTLTVALDESIGDDRPAVISALSEALSTHGYVLSSVKITVKATKDVSDQLALPLVPR